ncbi:hypothetical protein L345_01283, partial [Ophiophagus hannah]
MAISVYNQMLIVGPPMPSSSSSQSVIEHLHSPPPSPNLHDNQRWLLSTSAIQPVQDSDTDEDYTASSYLVQTGPVSVFASGHEMPYKESVDSLEKRGMEKRKESFAK